jgi:hypothetical protein
LRPYLEKILHKKRAGGVAQGVVDPEFKPQYCKKKKKKDEDEGAMFHRGCGTLLT